jgi:hypothetical protein
MLSDLIEDAGLHDSKYISNCPEVAVQRQPSGAEHPPRTGIDGLSAVISKTSAPIESRGQADVRCALCYL